MTSAAETQLEALLLRDGEGNYYEIPRGVIASYRVSAARKAELDAATGEDVTGFRDTRISATGLYVWSEARRRWIHIRSATDEDMGIKR